MLRKMVAKMMDRMLDDAITRMLTTDYPDNPFVMFTMMRKLTPRAIVEAGIRAELSRVLQRPIGSPVVLSPWEELLFNSKQLFELPTPSIEQIQTKTIIGPHAKRPLALEIPILITGMSYGGSLSLPMKIALAKGASMAGTSTNTGESSVVDEERKNAKLLIGQYNRGMRLTRPDQLQRLDAVEIQLGQGAYGGAVESLKDPDSEVRKKWQLEAGNDGRIRARFPEVNSSNDVIQLVNRIKGEVDVPVGVKIAGSDYIEKEMEVITKTHADFITIDGAEGGTAVAPPTLQENVGLPTLHSLVRAIDWLHKNHVRDRFTIIAAGGLKTPGHFLKAMALGADAVYIGSIALMAALQTQMAMAIALPQSPPPQLALYQGKLKNKLNIEKSARNLANFLCSCILEMKLAVQAVGKTSFQELSRDDLVSVDKDLAEFIGIRYAGSPRQ